MRTLVASALYLCVFPSLVLKIQILHARTISFLDAAKLGMPTDSCARTPKKPDSSISRSNSERRVVVISSPASPFA